MLRHVIPVVLFSFFKFFGFFFFRFEEQVVGGLLREVCLSQDPIASSVRNVGVIPSRPAADCESNKRIEKSEKRKMGSTAEILANKHYPLYYVAIHENDDPQPVIVCLSVSVCARASLFLSKSVQFDPWGTKVFFFTFWMVGFFFFFFYSVEKKYSFYIFIVTMRSIHCGCLVPGNPSQPI